MEFLRKGTRLMLRFSSLPRNLHSFSRIACRSVEYKPHELDNSFYDLLEEMQVVLDQYRDHRIPGITASQLGVDKRVLMLRIDPRLSAAQSLWMVNPYISSCSRLEDKSQERSLSIPNIECILPRANLVEVYGIIDNSFEERKFRFSDRGAWFIQHLIDQLNGISFTDKADQITSVEWRVPLSKPRID